MCIHPRVMEEGDRDTVDSMCRNMTASWVRQKAQREDSNALCQFYESFEREGNDADIPMGVYDLDQLKVLGRQRGWCPYFLTRKVIFSHTPFFRHLSPSLCCNLQAINRANIIVYNYQYMLDPKVSNLISLELERESIVVFDEAHNIDNVCIEALSVTIDKRGLDSSSRLG
jgi:DNA excision repair protein ERCC-2